LLHHWRNTNKGHNPEHKAHCKTIMRLHNASYLQSFTYYPQYDSHVLTVGCWNECCKTQTFTELKFLGKSKVNKIKIKILTKFKPSGTYKTYKALHKA
jgi:hypothetical protein